MGMPQYSGNISSTMSAIGHRTPTGKFETTVGETYRYDQLERLKSSSFASMASAAWSATTQYATSYSYDANGNLDTLDRNAHDSSGSNAMDKLRYSYQSGNNMLVRVTDAVTGDPFKEDITSQPANNYQYDASGNLTRDLVLGVTYSWNADGSIRQVKATPTGRTTVVDYKYDVSGNRVVKVQSDLIQGQAMSTVTTTFYVYGGDGSVMSIYEKRCSYPYDSDLDGKPDSVDKCPYMASMGNLDSDGDGVGDPCDNCPTTWNPDQADSDRDGIGDVCDNCASIWNPTQKDNNHNGIGDVCEVGYPIPDSDGDGLADNVDPCPLVPNYGTTGGDADEDGIPNNCDNCVSVANANQRDVNRNGVGDACETIGGGGCEYVLVEQPIYGLGREGEVVTGGQPLSTPASDTTYTRYVGKKLYELSDHLGNARVMLSDRKLSDIVGGFPKKFRADVRSYANLYPFGMEQPGRYMGGDVYRYGYQGMEKDSGAGAEQYTTYFRAYDPRIGRWLSTDPVTHVGESPYAAMGNSPMAIVDPSGASGMSGTGGGKPNGGEPEKKPESGESTVNKGWIQGPGILPGPPVSPIAPPGSLLTPPTNPAPNPGPGNGLWSILTPKFVVPFATIFYFLSGDMNPMGKNDMLYNLDPAEVDRLGILIHQKQNAQLYPTLFQWTNREEYELVNLNLKATAGDRAIADAYAQRRTFSSKDPLVAVIANMMESAVPKIIVDVNKPVPDPANPNDPFGEYDIELPNAIIQVKSGKKASRMIAQVYTTRAALAAEGKQKDIYFYGPYIKGNQIRDLQKEGVRATNKLDILLDWLGIPYHRINPHSFP